MTAEMASRIIVLLLIGCASILVPWFVWRIRAYKKTRTGDRV